MDMFLVRPWGALKSRAGQSLVEYALILALVAVVVVTALTMLGSITTNKVGDMSNMLANTPGSTTAISSDGTYE